MTSSNVPRRFSFVSAALLGLALATGTGACAAGDDTPGPAALQADEAVVVRGVPDKGENPAVIALDVAGTALCSASLIAPDVLLTARHCVAETIAQITCPPRPGEKQVVQQRAASSLRAFAGDDFSAAKEVARGREILTPAGDALCDADIALVVLDRAVDGIEPMGVRAVGVAKGDRVRAVGFGRTADGGPAGTKLLRDHVKVLDVSLAEFLVGEATCQGDSGGPALDETTGEIVGVVSRGGPACDGPGVHNIYTRTDSFLPLIDEALAKGAASTGSAKAKRTTSDAGRAAAPKKKKPTSDMGGACQTAKDCAAGVCVKETGKQYCSRPCDPKDRCPAHFRCTATGVSKAVCSEM